MKRPNNIRNLLILLTILVCLSCGSLTAGATNVDTETPIFIMGFMDDENAYATTAFYLRDTYGDGSTYLVTSDASTSLLDAGCEAYILGSSYAAEATYLTSVDNFAFYSAPDLEEFVPLEMGTIFTDSVSTSYLSVIDGEITGVTTEVIDLTTWVDLGSFLYAEGVKLPDLLHIGAPVMSDNDNRVVGCISLTSDSEIAITPLLDIEFPVSAAIVTGAQSPSEATAPETSAPETDSPETDAPTEEGAAPPDETDSTPEPEDESAAQPETDPVPSPTDGDAPTAGTDPAPAPSDSDGSDSTTFLIGIAAIAAIVFIVSRNQSKKTSSSPTSTGSSESYREGTIALEPQHSVPAPTAFSGDIPGSDQWQVRGVGGQLDSQVFLLYSSLKFGRSPQCDVVFPQNTPGISGLHCELAIEDGRVILRDMQSTYGTYLTKGVKMEPRINYYLSLGDEFTLAEGGQTFRLEKEGAFVQEFTPAVRSVPGGTIYRADADGQMIFGRDPRSQVSFDPTDSSISSRHCILYRKGDRLYLMDTGSTNGTFLGEDQRLKPNVAYHVQKGMSFFLVSPKYTFVITED